MASGRPTNEELGVGLRHAARQMLALYQLYTQDNTLITHSFAPLSCMQSGIRYPVVVRFDNQNYAGVSTNNYALDEVVDK